MWSDARRGGGAGDDRHQLEAAAAGRAGEHVDGEAKQSEGLRAVLWQTHDPDFEAEGDRAALPPALQSYAR